MEYSEGRTANAIGGRTARACENCLRKRARWFCAADDAFLCQACDTSVHSANQLASRHERVRLETSSSSSFRMKGNSTATATTTTTTTTVVPQPIWHQGFTRKARTPRHKKQKKVNNIVPALVPEIGGDQESSFLDEIEEQDQQLLLMQQYSVPVFEPLLFDDDDHHQLLCISGSTTNNNNNDSIENQGLVDHEIDLIMGGNDELNFILDNNDNDMELMASDGELAEFAADVESLLRTESSAAGVILDNDENEEDNKRSVKIELDESNPSPGLEIDYYFDNNNNYIDTVKQEEHQEQDQDIDMKRKMKRLISLKLNYEEVMTAWDKNSNCPWINGTRPDFNSAADNPDFDFLLIDNGTSTGMMMQQQIYNKYGGSGGRNEEREARVSRYREKRRSRLFSKKIRYEVRKLNAEKRPRMKGRFVKRTT